MKRDFKYRRIAVLILFIFCVGFFMPMVYGQQSQPPETEKKLVKNPEIQTISPGPRNAKEKVALFVFLVWLWIAIGVSIYLIRLKIIEADRLYEFHFYGNPKDRDSPTRHGS